MYIPHPLFPIRLKKGAEKTLLKGFPWVYEDDIIETSELVISESGSLVDIVTHKGEWLGIGYYNHKSRIACRILSRKRIPIDEAFFHTLLQKALAKREKNIPVPYYRLVHSESDGLPGLLIDRFGDAVVCQIGTAGMERLQKPMLQALESLVSPNIIIFRNDNAARTLEGLKEEVHIIKGSPAPLVKVNENGCWYYADLLRGQKTGWFYDQRDNRAMMAAMSKGKTVLDMYSHSGGFGIPAALAGAAHVTMVDSSALALDLARQAAELNNVAHLCETVQGSAFDVMQSMHEQGMLFDVVNADPPAFVKSKKDVVAGMKGYEKVAKYSASLVKEGGVLYIASCSHHATRPLFNKAVMAGIAKAGRTGEIIAQTGGAPDHPVHPQLPQSGYLKATIVRIA